MKISFKYIAGFIAAIAMLAISCNDEDEPSTKNKGKQMPVVTIENSVVKDSTVTVLVSAPKSASQYAFVVLKGKGNPTPSPVEMIYNKFPAKAVVSGIVNSADSLVSRVEFATLQTSDYEVFAAAITAEGLIGDVTRLQVLTPDSYAPLAKSATATQEAITLTFNEDVAIGLGTIKVALLKEGSKEAVLPVVVESSKIKITGNVVDIEWPSEPGSLLLIRLDEGAFKDATGNLSAVNEPNYNPETKKWIGLAPKVAEVDMKIEESYFINAGDQYTSWNTFKIYIQFPKNIYFDPEVLKDGAVTITSHNDITTGSVTAVPEAMIDIVNNNILSIGLPIDLGGVYFDVNIAAGLVTDEYSNGNQQYTSSATSKKYCTVVADVEVGDYDIGIYAYEPYSCKLTIAARKDKGTYDVSGFFGVPAISMYATFNPFLRELTMTGAQSSDPTKSWFFQKLGGNESLILAMIGSGNDGKGPIVFATDENGTPVRVITGCEIAVFNAADGEYLGSSETIFDDTPITKHVPPTPSPAVRTNAQRIKSFNEIALIKGNTTTKRLVIKR